MDKAYLEKKYHTTEHNIYMDEICHEYNLNIEQERAFRIIGNHVVLPNSEPLKMYIQCRWDGWHWENKSIKSSLQVS